MDEKETHSVFVMVKEFSQEKVFGICLKYKEKPDKSTKLIKGLFIKAEALIVIRFLCFLIMFIMNM